jgi:putative tryptophan/tyrosine transport system substrate-binding protein
MMGHWMRRRELLTLLGGAVAASAAWPLAARAQQGRIARIGYLGATSYYGQQPRVEALRAGLRDLGYTEGRNAAAGWRIVEPIVAKA